SATVGAAALAAGGALRLYEHFAGENPPLDLAYDVWLRSRPLAALDSQHEHNPSRTNLIVTLTTLPSRVDRIAPTLKSLLNQRSRAAAIRLNVPTSSRREQRPYDLPRWLQQLRSITVVRCEDFGPATKLIPTLASVDPDQPIVVVDDDRI